MNNAITITWVCETAAKDPVVAIGKVRPRLGWESPFSNTEALPRNVAWYAEHRERFAGAAGVTHPATGRRFCVTRLSSPAGRPRGGAGGGPGARALYPIERVLGAISCCGRRGNFGIL